MLHDAEGGVYHWVESFDLQHHCVEVWHSRVYLREGQGVEGFNFLDQSKSAFWMPVEFNQRPGDDGADTVVAA